MNKILGIWKSDPEDEPTQREFGVVTMEFKENGDLIYTIFESDKMQKMFLTYEIRGNILISDQPSSPKRIETEFRILPDGKLELNFDGVISKCIKI